MNQACLSWGFGMFCLYVIPRSFVKTRPSPAALLSFLCPCSLSLSLPLTLLPVIPVLFRVASRILKWRLAIIHASHSWENALYQACFMQRFLLLWSILRWKLRFDLVEAGWAQNGLVLQLVTVLGETWFFSSWPFPCWLLFLIWKMYSLEKLLLLLLIQTQDIRKCGPSLKQILYHCFMLAVCA